MRGNRGENRETKISRQEIVKALEELKIQKAVGEDRIPGEVWKYGGKRLEGYIEKMCNKIWRGEE